MKLFSFVETPPKNEEDGHRNGEDKQTDEPASKKESELHKHTKERVLHTKKYIPGIL